MIEITNYNVWGFEGAIRGMRMPYESFDKSDSVTCMDMYPNCGKCPVFNDFKQGHSYCVRNVTCNAEKVVIGPNDMELAKKLIKAGSEHRKFLRMIHVQAEIRAPRYWWQEARTYKYLLRLDPNGLDMNSSSTMHLITKRELTLDDFSYTPLSCDTVKYAMDEINCKIQLYNQVSDRESRDKVLIAIKQMLPEAFMQRVMVDTNYEALLGIYHQRHAHRLSEWKDFCDWIERLPYMHEFSEAMK